MEDDKLTPRRVAQAYLSVLGSPTARNAGQKIVWADLEGFCHAYRLSVESVPSAEMPENNCLVNEGRRSVWLRARGMVLSALAPEAAPLKSTRKRKP